MSKKSIIHRCEKLEDGHPARAYGYKYSVQELRIMNDGRCFYTGNGKFCKTKREADEYIKAHSKRGS